MTLSSALHPASARRGEPSWLPCRRRFPPAGSDPLVRRQHAVGYGAGYVDVGHEGPGNDLLTDPIFGATASLGKHLNTCANCRFRRLQLKDIALSENDTRIPAMISFADRNEITLFPSRPDVRVLLCHAAILVDDSSQIELHHCIEGDLSANTHRLEINCVYSHIYQFSSFSRLPPRYNVQFPGRNSSLRTKMTIFLIINRTGIMKARSLPRLMRGRHDDL